MIKKKWLWIIIGMLASGCSVHPLTDEVTRQPTLAIVTAIRCEAREAIVKYAPGREFNDSAIGFVFNFDITEHNSAGLDLAFKQLFSNGTFDLALGSPSGDLTRHAQRRFTLVDTFAELKQAKCSPEALQSRFDYPIAGSIGLNEVIKTVMDVDKLANLENLSSNQVGGAAAVFSDDLTYTTKFDSGRINAEAGFNAVPGGLRLTKVAGHASSDRQDLHQLTLAIALPEPTTKKVSLRSAARTATAQQAVMNNTRGIPSKVLIYGTADPKLRVLWELDRRILLNQDDRLIDALGLRR